jgi:predicted secreted Zn-dependent protease
MSDAVTRLNVALRGLMALLPASLLLLQVGCGQSRGVRPLPLLPALPAGVTAEVSEVSYIVRGTTVPEIRLSLRTAATSTLGSDTVGLHSSRLNLEFGYTQQGNHCVMNEVTIRLESAIQVPEWTERGRADFRVVAMWDRYVRAVRAHEYTHREHLYSRARDISQELYHIKSPTCASMQSRVRSTAARINDRYRQLSEQFDEESRGTITWPPNE